MAKDFNTLQNNINLKSDKTHNHDNRYFTESEVNNKLALKSDKTHNHNTAYYTKTESDARYNSDGMPVGTILMFDANHTSGSSGDSGAWVDNSTMPGWYACVSGNQDKGCPNLVDRFVMGKGISGSGVVGGANTRTLTISNMPSHNHSMNNPSANHKHSASHDHPSTGSYSHGHNLWSTNKSSDSSVSGMGGNDSDGIGVTGGGTQAWYSTIHDSNHVAVSTNTHSHSVPTRSMSTGDVSAWHTHSINNTGSGSAFDNRPAYYSIIFIRKCS